MCGRVLFWPSVFRSDCRRFKTWSVSSCYFLRQDKNWVLSNELIKVELPPWKIWKADVIRSDEGLTLETSAFQIFHGGNSTFINSFDKTQFCFDLSHRRSTTVSLETRNSFLDKKLQSLQPWVKKWVTVS